MKRSILVLGVAALLTLPVAGSAETNDELFRQKKDQVALFPSLSAIPSAVKRMVVPNSNARAQAHARSTTKQRDFLW